MIRPAELSDAAAIQEINATALGYDFGLIETRQKLSELLDRSDHFILVAENAAGQLSAMPMQLAMIASIFRLYSTCWH